MCLGLCGTCEGKAVVFGTGEMPRDAEYLII